jgi:hypothetical protein
VLRSEPIILFRCDQVIFKEDFEMTSPKLAVILVVGFVCLALSPLAAAEEPPAESPLILEPALSTGPAACTGPANLGEAPEPAVLLATAGTCSATADCWDGSQRTCTASGTSAQCSFVDSNCPDQRGYCWSSDEGYKYCPRCPCNAPPCSKYEGQKCKPGTRSPLCDTFGICAHCFCTSGGIYICP